MITILIHDNVQYKILKISNLERKKEKKSLTYLIKIYLDVNHKIKRISFKKLILHKIQKI